MSNLSIPEVDNIINRYTKARFPPSILAEIPSSATIEDTLDWYDSISHHRFFPSIIFTESHGIVIILSAIKHTFPSSKFQWFTTVIAPKSVAGIYAMKIDKPTASLPNFTINDEVRVNNSDFPGILNKDSISKVSCVPFPTTLLEVLSDSEFLESIDAKKLAIRIESHLGSENVPQTLIDFLFQCHVTGINPEEVKLSLPSARGRESWVKLKDMLSNVPINELDSPNFSTRLDCDYSSVPPVRKHSTAGSLSDESDDMDSNVPKKPRRNLDGYDLYPWLKEIQSLNVTLANKIMSTAADNQTSNVLSLEDKSSWFKKAPETIREWLINLRAGPTMENPVELSCEMDSILKKTSSKQQADLYIPVLIGKMTNVRHFDCMAGGQDFENWFKHGEFKQSKMVSDFAQAFGMNFHSLGPKDPINKPFTVTSANGLKHKVFIPAHFVELEDSAANLLALNMVIAGAGHESYATLALRKLLEFYRSYKTDIKQMCEFRSNLLQDIQIQLGNEWNAFLIKASSSPPNAVPDFEFVTSQIERGKPPMPFLPVPTPNQPYTRKNNYDGKQNGKKNNAHIEDRVNHNPQVQMEGSNDNERFDAFRKQFGQKGLFRSLSLPTVDSSGNASRQGKPICMHFQLANKCSRKVCSFHHGKLSEDVLATLIEKTKHLKVKKT